MNIGRCRQSLTAIACAFGSLIMGILNTWPSYTSELLFSNATTPLSAPITEAEEALLGSLPSLGAMAGTAIAGPLMNIFGRRNGGILIGLPVLLSWSILTVASSVNLVLAARFLAGISGGGALMLAPIFTAEVAEDAIRGLLASAPVFFYCTGTVVSYLTGWCMSYRSIILFNLVLSILSIGLLALVTESPVYLLRKKKEDDAKLAIAKYRGVSISSITVLDEITKLKQQIMPSVELVPVRDSDTKPEESEKEKLNLEENAPVKLQSTSSFKLLFFQPSSRRALIVVTALMTLQVFMGSIPVQVYAKTVFLQTDPSMADMYTIVFAVVLFLGSAFSAILTEKAGRRMLTIVSSVLVFLSMAALGYLLQFKAGPPIVTVLTIFTYCFVFMAGAGSIPYVLLAEAFIPEVQNLASLIIIEWVWFIYFVIITVFPYMNNAFGIHGTFYIFASMGLINAVLAYMIVPETKGLSNAQIQDAFTPRKKN